MRNYLLFIYRHTKYGIPSEIVDEILWLPELTVLPELPREVIGVFNLRGRVVPVVDLDLKLKRKPERYRTEDAVIVLNQGDVWLGILANQALEVVSIPETAVESTPLLESQAPERLVTQVARFNNEIVALLDVSQLLAQIATLGEDVLEETAVSSAHTPLFCPEATPAERKIFQQRAQSYSQVITRQQYADLVPLAIVRLNQEYLALPLEQIKEFAPLDTLTPIPCTPSHIMGDINLRGDIITVIDIRPVLGLPITNLPENAQLAILQDIAAGIPLDAVLEVKYINEQEIAPLPLAMQSVNPEFISGVITYQNRAISLLNLAKIMTAEELVVNEYV